MRSLKFVVAVAVSMAMAAPVYAQPVVRDHTKGGDKEKPKGNDKDKDKDKPKVRDHTPPPQAVISVTGFSPTSGRVGTTVTITGSGFIAQDKVLVGGRPVNGASITANAITFQIPARFYDGVIAVRHPGSANDVVVGTFSVQADPKIAAFQPTSGPAGTQVEIHGSGFMNGDQVMFDNKVLAANALQADRIVVIIPQGATTDYFSVVRPGGITERSRLQFKVVQPAPLITSFAPTAGAPGTKVRITGANFAADDRVFYARAELKVEARADTWLDVTIPANANRSEALTVRGPRGEATTAQVFALVIPPVVGRFQPLEGPPGTRVEIHGEHFLNGDQVSFNGRPLKLVAFEEQKLTIEIPPGARSDTFLVMRGGQQVAAAKTPFNVLVAPTIASFTPNGGPVGTQVTITGTGFTADARVSYGAQALRIVARSGENTVTVQIPPGAVNQPFVVETKGGQVSSATQFQVYNYSAVSSVAPLTGPVGTRVTIRGTNFNGNDLFFLGNVSLAIVERAADAYVVQIPAGAASGPISWESYGKRQTSRFQFVVVLPPTFASFSPASGPAGTQVTIVGTNFTNSTAVFYGQLPCQVLRRTLPTQLLVVIPANATGTDYLWVDDGGTRLKSGAAFQVIAPPVLSSFSPASGPVGTVVTINGSNFTNNSTVMFNGVNAVITRRQLPSMLVVQVPAGAAGAVYIWVDDGNQKIRSTATFAVTVLPSVGSIAPLSGPAGTRVTITGDNFGPNATVWFGAASCPIVKRTGKMQLVVTIPAGAKGKAYLTIDDGTGQRVNSTDMFEALEPPPQPQGDDGTGHHEHAHQHPHEANDHHHHPHGHPHRPGSNHHHPY